VKGQISTLLQYIIFPGSTFITALVMARNYSQNA